jgi:YgiT-type zinc finger domain-containing protein
MGRLQEEEEVMRCVICHGESIKVMDVREEFAVGNDIVYIPVSVPVCKTCGERYYDRRTMQFLETIEEKIAEAKIDLKEVGKVLIYEEATHTA